VDYSASAVSVSVNLATNVNTGGDAQGDNLVGIANVIGSAGNDLLVGDANANSLRGGAGSDNMTGGGGADTLDGGTGVNWSGYYTSASGVTVNLTSGVNTGGDAQGDVLVNIQNLYGSQFADSLTGDANANYIAGDAGNDTIEGGAGADTLDGGLGV